TRQKRAGAERDLFALADYLAECIDRLASVRAERLLNIERLQSRVADFIPNWGIAPGRHIIVIGADQRILARLPIDASLGASDGILDAISTAQLLAAPGRLGIITDLRLPNGNRAMATAQLIKALPGRVIVIQERLEPIWGS